MSGVTVSLELKMTAKNILIMAGGTGGHIFPALAIAKQLKQEGHNILWLGTYGRLDEVLVPKHGFDIAFIDVKGIRGNGLKRKLIAPFMITKALLQSLKIINKFKPDVVVGMGGYASGPGGLAAFLKGIPLILHEQNAAAGLTNRLLFKLASKVLLGFEGAFSGNKVSVVGNPVRAEIIALNGRPCTATQESKLKILIVGGSLGAVALNEKIPDTLTKFADKIEVLHQCGKGNSQKVSALYKDAQFKVQVSDFIDDMAKAYSETHLVICRAGALTVSETICANVPAIFIPLPSAVDDHQTKNAKFAVDRGGALLIAQKDLSGNYLYEAIDDLLKHREKLCAMQKSMHDMAKIDSTSTVVDIIKSYF